MPGSWHNPNKDRKPDIDRHVPGEGPVPCDVMLVGERPGKEESWAGRPFQGPSGKLMDQFLRAEGLWRGSVYVTNIVKYAAENDRRPDAAEIRRDAIELDEEFQAVRPKYVGLVGATAVHQFLPDVDLEWGHGMAFQPDIKVTKAGWGWAEVVGMSCWVMPIYHPAFGLRSPDSLPLVQDDFHWFAEMCKQHEGVPVWTPDKYPKPDYKEWKDGDSKEIEAWFKAYNSPTYIDTEGYHWLPWGLSVTDAPGWSRVIHRSSKHALKTFTRCLKSSGRLVYLHNSLHDIEVLAGGLGIEGYEFIDTMIQAYHLCIEPQGLKPLARRYAGMEMSSYDEIIREASHNKAMDYLVMAYGAAQEWESNQSDSASSASSKTRRKAKKAKKSTSASAGTRSQRTLKFPASKAS